MTGSCIRSSGGQREACAQGEQGTLTRPQAQQGRGAACLQGKQPLRGEQAGAVGPCSGDGGAADDTR